ncbi:molybdopterin molybdotransferase MoeA [Carbonactinospora thermoautotrophica]|uniref:molybdopterin molybdotransferase MoeA n=1 Tax=Carbonactinospora thermoautotrophica TaxID=1469144 RepID=UPI000AF49035|nr:molybdopterin-binding protein [Carbonactinospora thermoautotrophica]
MTVAREDEPGIAWEEARALAARVARPLAPVSRALNHCLGHVLARPLVALTDLPTVDTAGVDGWAVAGPGPWRVRTRKLGDRGPVTVLADGEAVEVSAGARLPAGATAVLRPEHGRLDGRVLRGVAGPGSGIRPRGVDCHAGEELLPAGTTVTPAVIGLAAAAGYDELPVVPRPSVDLVVIAGDGLTRGVPRDGVHRDALAPLLPAWLRQLRAEVPRSRRVENQVDELRAAIESSRADVILVAGRTVRGTGDPLHRLLGRMRAAVLIDGVAVRPGHPVLLARLAADRFVVGLPANPLAAVTGLLTVLAPLLGRLAGDPPARRRTVRLTAPVGGHAGFTRLVPLRDGAVLAHAGPALLGGLAQADGLAVIPPGGARSGAEVELLPLPW